MFLKAMVIVALILSFGLMAGVAAHRVITQSPAAKMMRGEIPDCRALNQANPDGPIVRCIYR